MTAKPMIDLAMTTDMGVFAAGFAAGRRTAEQEVLDRIDRQQAAVEKKFNAEADKDKRRWLAAGHSALGILRARIACRTEPAMSSTNRGAVRQADDFYSTPAWCVRAIWPHVQPCWLVDGRQDRAQPMDHPSILEPAAGDGAILRALQELHPGAYLSAHEIDSERARALKALKPHVDVSCGDWLGVNPAWVDGGADLIITNPPYSLAMEFIEHALAVAWKRTHCTVVMLLRLNFLGSQKRAAWHRAYPSDVYVLPKRPSFTEHLRPADGEERCPQMLLQTGKSVRCDRANGHDGGCMTIGTDSCEYAWFVWGPGRGGRWDILEAP